MNKAILIEVFKTISATMDENKDYLIELDQQNGDGDLGVSMSEGYQAALHSLENNEETDLGKLMMKAGSAFNEAAPSSLGTISAFGFMGIAKAWKGHEEVGCKEIGDGLMAGIEKIMEKAGSKPGEKTILDAIYPAAEAWQKEADTKAAASAAAKAAAEGSEATKGMKSVHGRAAYYGEKSIGILDGGSVVGKLLFAAIDSYVNA